ncbi:MULTISPECIES: STAS domain-containing protein [unclassified Kitasatospora]|uniref:STAS domain-containing protein n=1 Tax=unclassified Kitasatospora TaxID=2633591 RepID=UPI002E2F3142|nr:STAS domain-containing protein [Kitasatospora sp. NBC_01246]
MNPLNITHRDAPTGPALQVVGDLDYEHAPTLRARVEYLALRPGQCLVIDLSGVEFCDSSGITALLAARRHTQAAGAELTLTAVPENTLRILAITGLTQIFTIV